MRTLFFCTHNDFSNNIQNSDSEKEYKEAGTYGRTLKIIIKTCNCSSKRNHDFTPFMFSDL